MDMDNPAGLGDNLITQRQLRLLIFKERADEHHT
jgi:hypothetical protein